MRTNEIPYWEKYMLTLREAAEYFHIGEKRCAKSWMTTWMPTSCWKAETES